MLYIYFCKDKYGKDFTFTSKACLDLGTKVKSPDGIKGKIEDMTIYRSLITSNDLHDTCPVSYGRARAMSL